MAYNHEYPYVDSGMSNADWILHKIKEMIAEWATMQDAWKELQEEFKQLNINFTDLENQFKQLITENNEFKTSITDIVNQFKTDMTNQFNEYKTEINNALSTFEQHITEEFTDLSNYVQTTINNLPMEVKNIFQTYIDDGTIAEMLKGLIPPDLSAQVEQNTNDISVIKVEQTTQDNKISNLETLNMTLEQTVNNHTTQIAQLQTEQTEIMNDIADINELDVQQNNRLTALEARPIGDNSEYIWFIMSSNLPNLANMVTTQIGTSVAEVFKTPTTFDNFPTIFDNATPAKTPTRIVVICSYTRTTSALLNLNNQIAALSEKIQSKYKGVQAYYVAPPSPINSCSAIQLMSAVVNTNGYSAANRSPFFHLVMNPTLVAYPNTEKDSNGDFETANAYRGFLYVRSLYDSLFCMGDVGFHMKYKVPLFSELGIDFDSGSIIVELSPNYITYTIAIYVKGRTNSSFDFPGNTATTIATVQSTQSKFVLLDMSFFGTLTFYHRDNRSSGGHTANIKVLRQTSNNTVNIDVSNLDYDAVSILTGFTLYGSFSMPWRTEADPIN